MRFRTDNLPASCYLHVIDRLFIEHDRLREACAPAEFPSEEHTLSHVLPAFSASSNHLLAALPPDSLARVARMLEPVELVLHATLHVPRERLTKVHFPVSGWVSMLAPLENGDVAEVGLVGKEGMIGLPLLLGAQHDNLEAMVQGSGAALAMNANAFREAVETDIAFRTSLLSFAMAHLIQVSRTAACNGHHLLEQRLARWLLMSHDRAAGDEFAMTHDFLGMMLGVRRAGVTVAAGALQKAGLIRYERGSITVTDRGGLEDASCECYHAARRDSRFVAEPDAP